MAKIIFLLAFLTLGNLFEFEPRFHRNWDLLNHDICGQVSSERIIGGEEAPMNAYPWIVRIGYLSFDSEIISFRCGGVVASSQVVVTAAHCVTNLGKNEVAVIRFGEHNTETDPDCEGDFCADPIVDVKPLEILIPNNYNEVAHQHDIALIRLSKEIKFTAFIKPICFPYDELHKKDWTGSVAEVAGWGIFDIDDPVSSTTLQVVKIPIIKNEECRSLLRQYATIGPTQLCVGGIIGKDSCGGDSGGPLMKVDDWNGKPRYYFLGIVSFGSRKCGKTKMPGIYTKMSSYMEWFLDNLVEKSGNAQKVY